MGILKQGLSLVNLGKDDDCGLIFWKITHENSKYTTVDQYRVLF